LTPLVSGRVPDRTSTPADRDGEWDELLSSAGEAAADGGVAVDNGLVTESLDEILLAMIASSSTETHGTGLMEELERQFDVQLSPGTVYPRLHELEDDGTLAVHELVQTKQYSVSDRSAAKSRIERAVQQHLAMGMFLQTALDAM
jgi:hypothetical protein